MGHQDRLHSFSMRDVGGLHMDKMDINPCQTSKTEKLNSGSSSVSSLDSEERGWQSSH